MFEREHNRQTGAEREIRRRIAASGAITFAEFMEVALYHPDGYYANRGRIGNQGDYFTSPVAHPAYGALICVQIETMWRTLDRPAPFYVIEAGAGDGILANDIVTFAGAQFPELSEAIRYVAVDRTSPGEISGSAGGVEWIVSTGLPIGGAAGCVVANELLDAMPVHRFEMVDGEPREVYVSLDHEHRFVELPGDPSTLLIAERVESIGRELPDGSCGEVNAGIGSWIRSVAQGLERGYVLTVDYGYEREELYSEERRLGTLQTYYRHTDSGSPYQRVGRQDMTAHADFTALIDEGRSAGLRPVFLTTQGEFLSSLGYSRLEESIGMAVLSRYERQGNVRAMRQLIDPEGLGRFKVLVQEAASGIRRASELVPGVEVTDDLRAPVTDESHLPLTERSALSFG